MRYAQGGGLTAERRAFREQIRLDAGEMFAAGSDNAEVAKSLPRLSDELFVKLEAALALGAAAHGWPDERWTLARIRKLIGRMFHKSYTGPGVRLSLGWPSTTRARTSWSLPRDASTG
ncbi:hypothetical protein [Streptomyces sp. SP17KL33]|uniref:hypothetical protein n=1 Tax=Streptomyces sp. SP17KL33 TaxID=3002534 RepID=UPI002E75F792|nr:hypothetical protein [Streptomyces sp. SP17KL33]